MLDRAPWAVLRRELAERPVGRIESSSLSDGPVDLEQERRVSGCERGRCLGDRLVGRIDLIRRIEGLDDLAGQDLGVRLGEEQDPEKGDGHRASTG